MNISAGLISRHCENGVWRQRLERTAYFLADVRLVNSAFHDNGDVIRYKTSDALECQHLFE